MVYGHPLPDFPKNTRDEVVNLAGESKSPAQHDDSPKTVTDARVSVALTSGKRNITIENSGDKDCYYGNVSVISANGKTLFSNGESVFFPNCKDGWMIYLITSTGETTTLRIVET